MTQKTPTDCANYLYLSYCDAHISGGMHKHRDGPDPCEFTLQEDKP